MTLGPGPLEYVQAFSLVLLAGVIFGFVLGWTCRARTEEDPLYRYT